MASGLDMALLEELQRVNQRLARIERRLGLHEEVQEEQRRIAANHRAGTALMGKVRARRQGVACSD